MSRVDLCAGPEGGHSLIILALAAILLSGCQPAARAAVGPPCPTSLPAEQGGALKPINVAEFDGMTFARRFGDAECEYEGSGGRAAVCRFTSPAVLEVKTGQGTYVFAPGIGQPAVVIVRKGVAICELAPRG